MSLSGLKKMSPHRYAFCHPRNCHRCRLEYNSDNGTPLMMVQELRDSFRLNHYILVSRVFADPSAPIAVLKKKLKAVSPCCHK